VDNIVEVLAEELRQEGCLFFCPEPLKIRLDRDRAERRQKKEEVAEQRKQEQPAMFDF